MKKLISSLMLILIPLNILVASQGAFLIVKSTYLYDEINKSGRKFLTRSKKAFEVIDIKELSSGSLMFQIIYPLKKTSITGSGFIVENDLELKELGTANIKVYNKIPQNKKENFKYKLIPANQFLFSGKQSESPVFKNILFRAVNYKAKVPKLYWVDRWAGIFRADKTAEWLNDVHQRLKAQKQPWSITQKILMGSVETGFTKEQVLMSLGQPEKEIKSDDGKQDEWVYPHYKLIFENEKVVRVL
ncbi:MAG: DUF2845 domain-containing protein [Deltaproteobacteria bacterium]|nr:DUF2845 domain-containing protein [Deltaproteobacteria bacterium]